MTSKIGFMQGRLSPLVNGMIQSFPWQFWQSEFSLAEKLDLGMMEWTLDQHRLYENPLLTDDGQKKIKELCARHAIRIPSLTGDCFMQSPFWKVSGDKCIALERDFVAIATACITLGITYIVVPLVDNGRLDTSEQEDRLVEFLQDHANFFIENHLKIVFESDFPPVELARFIKRLDPKIFGINYDVGNSAALGFNPTEEFAAYGQRILNLHVKDRMLGGTTVALGKGNANFEAVFKELGGIDYQGNFILQTARAEDNDHAKPLARYRDMTSYWIDNFGLSSYE
tara:strand:+ start:1301 stop:2152 length:852 start_codon:yes stop_codon:yes gene_type:complete